MEKNQEPKVASGFPTFVGDPEITARWDHRIVSVIPLNGKIEDAVRRSNNISDEIDEIDRQLNRLGYTVAIRVQNGLPRLDAMSPLERHGLELDLRELNNSIARRLHISVDLEQALKAHELKAAEKAENTVDEMDAVLAFLDATDEDGEPTDGTPAPSSRPPSGPTLTDILARFIESFGALLNQRQGFEKGKEIVHSFAERLADEINNPHGQTNGPEVITMIKGTTSNRIL